MTHLIIRGLRLEAEAQKISTALQNEYGCPFSVSRVHRDWGVQMESENESHVQHTTARAFARGFLQGKASQ